jgi:SAM-dependent methyltransferase
VSVKDRLRAEQSFHDRQARQRALALASRSDRLRFDDDSYLDHETWIRPAMDQLGTVAGRSVLDYGCGHGMAAVVLARRGARVTAFDLSAGYLEETRNRAQANAVRIDLAQADGERLPFADGSFDHIWGNAVLHHLDAGKAGRELARVLKPGGIAVFSEPWGENRLLQMARKHWRYSGKQRTADELPLQRGHIHALREFFPSLETRGYQLFSMVRRVLPHGRVTASLDWCDDMLLARIPQLQRYCRYIVLTLRKGLL